MNKNDLPLALRNAISAEVANHPPMPEISFEIMKWLVHRCPEPRTSPLDEPALTAWVAAQRALVREIQEHYDQQE